MSDDGRLTPAWGVSRGRGPGAPEPGLAGLFDPPPSAAAPAPASLVPPVAGPPNPWTAVPQPPDPALLAAQHQAQLEASAAALAAADDQRRAHGSHRARRQPARYILPAVGAAIAVLLIGVGISGWFGSSQTASPSSPPITQHSLANTPSRSATPTPTPTPRPKPRVTHSVKAVVVAPAPPVVHAPTVVLNETTIRGLAAQVAAVLRSKYWVVTGIGNWTGWIGSTTVYYPPGMEAAARSLAHDLAVGRMRPSVPGMLFNRLTVVLTGNPF
jgi:hypothetical protein